MQRTISEKTLTFYQACPFNFVSSVEEAAKYICSVNLIERTYVDLDRILRGANVKSFLDAGCGIGWLSLTAEHYYDADVLGVDFNEGVVALARELAKHAPTSSARFQVVDLRESSQLQESFDVVCSLGVLHHIADPRQPMAEIASLLAQHENARLYLGLYHSYGRRPFLEYFERIAANGKSEEEQYAAFVEIHGMTDDEEYVRSRFRDQVLHPHETHHSLEEVHGWLDDLGFEIESSSINRYRPFSNVKELFTKEREYEQISYKRNFIEKKYFPGFFTVCARRKTDK